MEKLVVLLVSLFLMLFFRGQNGMAPDSCDQQQCPHYKLIKKNQDFEERLYAATKWITTKVDSSGYTDLMAAHSRLKDYCDRQSDAGYMIADDTWPVVITVTEDHDLSMSWFVAPDTAIPENTDDSVTLQSKPEATVYVRPFTGTPGIESAQENANALWEALGKHCTNLPTYSGVGYESYYAFTHHNEVWIYADDINCNKAK
ncbi:uncharacterized protein LOC143328692 [Chaetodon auriga]|uniref:uncharacterized protein LOC143328692 n=1 Tax=Chaetodon auriga TaxID=39042 RepID=UPI0040330AF7